MTDIPRTGTPQGFGELTDRGGPTVAEMAFDYTQPAQGD